MQASSSICLTPPERTEQLHLCHGFNRPRHKLKCYRQQHIEFVLYTSDLMEAKPMCCYDLHASKRTSSLTQAKSVQSEVVLLTFKSMNAFTEALILKLSTPRVLAVSHLFLFQLNSHNMLNTCIYHQLPSTCFGVCLTTFIETTALLAPKLCAFCNVAIKCTIYTFFHLQSYYSV